MRGPQTLMGEIVHVAGRESWRSLGFGQRARVVCMYCVPLRKDASAIMGGWLGKRARGGMVGAYPQDP